MSSYLCPSPSSLFHDRQLLCHSHQDFKTRRSTFGSEFQPLSLQSRAAPQVTHVSLQDPVSQEIQNPDSSEAAAPHHPIAKSASSPSKRHVWVNPKRSRGWELRQRSHDSRYASLVQIAEALDACEPGEEDAFRVLSGLGDVVVENDAVAVLNNMKNPEAAVLALGFFHEKLRLPKNAVLYNVALKVIRKRRDLATAEKLFDEMLQRGFKPNNVTFSTIISCAKQCYLPEKAVEWFEKMPTYGCAYDSVTGSIMIDAYGRTGNVDKALRLYECATKEQWRLDALSFATVIKIYGSKGDFNGCLKVYEEMKSLGVEPNLLTYNALLEAMGKARQPSQAKSIFKEMTSKGLMLNRTTYVALLRAYGRARYGDDAIFIYREMKRRGMELNVILYNTLLAMCADLGYVDEAVKIFEDMKGSACFRPDSWTYSSMLTAYACTGNVEEAESMLNEMVEAGFGPNIFVLTSLVQCYGKANRIDDVVRMVDQLIASGIGPDDRFCGCLLSVMAQVSRDELGKLAACAENVNAKLGLVVQHLLEESLEGDFKAKVHSLLDSVTADAKKPFCNSLIELCVKLNMSERASELLGLGLMLEIYTNLQDRTHTRWNLCLRSLSPGAAVTALLVWMNDLSKALENGEELPPVLGINTGHGKHKYSESEKVLASVFGSHLKELNAPFHEAPDMAGWFLTTKEAAGSWLESRRLVTA